MGQLINQSVNWSYNWNYTNVKLEKFICASEGVIQRINITVHNFQPSLWLYNLLSNLLLYEILE